MNINQHMLLFSQVFNKRLRVQSDLKILLLIA